MVYARRGGFTVQKFRNNKSKIKVVSISMADAGIPTPDPEIEFRREVDLDDIGQGDQGHFDDHDGSDRETLEEGHGDDVSHGQIRRDRHPRHEYNRNDRDNAYYQPLHKSQISLKPEPYIGRDCWEEYLSHFEDCAELGQWDNRTKLLFLAASLRGQARTFYMSLSPVDRRTYQSLTHKLDQRFGSSKHKNRWLSKLEMRKRMPGESIAELGDDIRQLAQKAYCNLDIEAQESLALNQLFKIISLEMKCRCIDKECQTILEAVDVIERYESIVGEGDRKKSTIRSVGSKDAERPSKNYQDNLQELRDRIEKLESEKRNQNIRRNNNSGRCYICNSTDHFMRNCPNKQKQSRTGNYQNGNRRGNSTVNNHQGNDNTLIQ